MFEVKEVKVGDRVAVYWYDGRFTGTVEKIYANGSLQKIENVKQSMLLDVANKS